ncbi:MAG: sigma-70 family RNA polymerase sigma factor [Eubacterium sp.]|nr:sigma-70 family RNA polymerase sigma factor [Eubacterium sp.]
MTREDELLRQIKKGRRECLDELVELYYPAILRYCMWHMPDTESAQDATQETFLKLVRFIDHYSHKGQFKAFLYKIAANTCIDVLRKNSTSELQTEPLSEQILSAQCHSESGFQTIEDRAQLAAALSCLEPEQRELVLLRYGQELTLKEISAVTGLPLRTIQTRLRRAIQKVNKSVTL